MLLKALTLLAGLVANVVSPALGCSFGCTAGYYLGLSEDALYTVGLAGIFDSQEVLKCRIQNTIGKRGVCDLYVKAYPEINPGHAGWPLNTVNLGSGCVRAPDFPKRVDTCFYARSEYDLTHEERSSFCTDSGKTNAVAQLRNAIENRRCTAH